MKSVMIMLLVALSLTALAADPTPQELLAQGVALLKEEKLVEAVKVLARASDGFEKVGEEDKAAEANSMLYWAKKRMTLAQANELVASAKASRPVAAPAPKDAPPVAAPPAVDVLAIVEKVVEAKVDPAQAKVWLVRAHEYARRTDDPLLKAIRYFEVAERFKGIPEGLQALDQSLKLMKQVASAPKPGPGGAVGKAVRGDGRLYVQSNPRGAQVLVMQDGELRDTGARTPALVQLPVGRAELVLRLPKHDEAKVSLEVTAQVSKPEPVLLQPERFDLDVVADPGLGEGWSVFVDGKPALDKAGKPAVAPCTVLVPEGSHAVQLAKEGFADPQAVRASVKAGGNAVVTVKGQARAGQSRAMALAAAAKAARLQRKTFSSDLKSVPFEVGAKCFGNRDYAVSTIVEEYKGWALLQPMMKTNLPVTFSLVGESVVLLVISPPEDQVPDGFKDTGKTCIIAGGAMKKVYAKVCSGRVSLPPSTGYFVLIESKP